jgi:uncharacterized protein YjeT (DUF2065 family)
MVPIKIQCGCGQRYAFDVEPVQGQMPYAIACPVCGIDGTSAANDSIAQSVAALMATAPTIASVAVAAPPMSEAAPAPRSSGRPAKEIDIIRVTNEARAKTMWGDEQNDVVKFIMLQGLSPQEAQKLAQALFAERAASVRKNGIGKIITGVGMMFVPVVVFIGMKAVGYIEFKILGVAIGVGLWGAYRVLRGVIMFFAPKSEPGDVATQ